MKYKDLLLKIIFIFFCLFSGLGHKAKAEVVYPGRSTTKHWHRTESKVLKNGRHIFRKKKLKKAASFGYFELGLLLLGLGMLVLIIGLIIQVQAVWITGLIIALFPFAAALVVALVLLIWLATYHGGLE